MTCLVISSKKAENCNFPFTKFACACSIFPFPSIGPLETLGEITSIDLAFRMSGQSVLFFKIPLLGSWLEETALFGPLGTPKNMSS